MVFGTHAERLALRPSGGHIGPIEAAIASIVMLGVAAIVIPALVRQGIRKTRKECARLPWFELTAIAGLVAVMSGIAVTLWT